MCRRTALPRTAADDHVVLILAGIGVVLLGIVFNGKAGLIREEGRGRLRRTDDAKHG